MNNLTQEAQRRRTFAIISHPDAGKSTLTEALALHAQVIEEAGAIHGKGQRKATVSDWMEMEKARGISISSTALQFSYTDKDNSSPKIINLVDTPGHADFSEDTYRVLTAVDSAVMLIDAAKGLEPQTLKLFQVCKFRNIPVITVINKWDRPGLEALALLDEIQREIHIQPTPLYWPVGIAGDFQGLLDRSTGEYIEFTRTAGGSKIAPETRYSPDSALKKVGTDWSQAVEESDLLSELANNHQQATFLAGTTSPVIFTSATLNFGVKQVLTTLINLAPPPSARADIAGNLKPIDDPFSAIVFKVQAGMDAAHRDRLAFIRIVSGEFQRGEVVTHTQTGKPFTTKYAQTVFGRNRNTLETAYPGDIVGLVNATTLKPGDSLYQDKKVEFPPIPIFAPEHFAVARITDLSRHKAFRKAISQVVSEGIVQLLTNEIYGENAPVLAAVGPMQFEVVTARLQTEFKVEITLENLPFSLARETNAEGAKILSSQRGVGIFTRNDGKILALFTDKWRLNYLEKELPTVSLLPLIAAD